MSPAALGKKDVLITGGKIAAIENTIDVSIRGFDVDVIDGSEHFLLPGFVDSLVHITGGGGEGGFTTRTPEMNLTDATKAGITTLVGALGTDATTRSLPDLLAKAKALNEQGLSCYCYTGSYQIPVRTLTSSVMDDIILINEFIGVGEVAISDHRSSQPTLNELAKIAAEARVGGMLSGKSGIVSIHTGDGRGLLDILHQVANETDIPITQFYPTHINRSRKLLEAGATFAQAGGYIDLTTSTTKHALATGEVKSSQGLKYLLDNDVPINRITFSSDGHASLPDFDDNGRLLQLLVGDESSLFQEVKDAVVEQNIDLEEAIKVITSNPADILGLKQKGRLAPGNDADCVLVSRENLEIETVISNGRIMVRDGDAVIKGQFES